MLDLWHLCLFFLFLASWTKYWQWISCTFRDATPKFRSSATTHPNNKNWPIKFNTNQPLTTHHTCRDKKVGPGNATLVFQVPFFGWNFRSKPNLLQSAVSIQTGRMRVDQRNQLKRMGTNNWLLWSLKDSPKKNNYIPVLCYFLNELWLPNIFPKSMIVKKLRTTSDRDSVNHETNKPRHGRKKKPVIRRANKPHDPQKSGHELEHQCLLHFSWSWASDFMDFMLLPPWLSEEGEQYKL